jgi:UDP-N-acetylglucosamine 1-carboxyvinyltransferase
MELTLDQFIIEGGRALHGTVTPSGNKNAAQPILAASLLTDEAITIRNLPRIRDVDDLLALLASVGVEINEHNAHEITLRARNIRTTELDSAVVERFRGSILLAGPMLARVGRVKLPPPGGDVIGRRRIDTHLAALRAIGASISFHDSFEMHATELCGAQIFLDEASVTATENALMAAVLAKGTTIIRNAACEPHVQELCHLLNRMGAQIEGIGSNSLTIQGVAKLRGATAEIAPDYIEVGSFIGLGAMTHGEILIRNAAPEQLPMVLLVFERLGIKCEIRGRDIFVPANQSLKIKSDLHDAIQRLTTAFGPPFQLTS